MKKPITAAIALAVIISACGSNGNDSATATTAAQPNTTQAASPTTAKPTTTTDAPTTEAPTTTELTCPEGMHVATNGTHCAADATTTTVDTSASDDLLAIQTVGALRDGTNQKLSQALIDILEPSPLERVDVLSGCLDNEGHIIVVVDATSGYATDERQQKAAADAVANLAELWGDEIAMFSKTSDKVPVGLDLTVDGHHYLLDNATMRAIAARQTAPADALANSQV